MGRRRARILSRSKPTNPPAIPAVVVRKRKIEEVDIENEEENIDVNHKRRRQYKIKNTWIPISEDASIPSCSVVPNTENSPPEGASGQETPPRLSDILSLSNKFRFKNYVTTPIDQHDSPLPPLSWADPQGVWHNMLQKERTYTRDPLLFNKHPFLQPRMRAILLDWLIEVCEVYRLHRETYYLAVDYIDRYLSCQRNIAKQQLQLIGITSVFIAAKLEEIYPPKLTEFAYVTDGACTDTEILDQEMIMLKTTIPLNKVSLEKMDSLFYSIFRSATYGVLNWDLSPMSIQSWLNVFLQIASVDRIPDPENKFVVPQYSAHTFIQVISLTDLCILATSSLQFTYSVIATSALYHMCSTDLALSVSGYKWHDICACVQWMTPYATTVREQGPKQQKFFPTIPASDSHNIQTHDVDLMLLEKAQSRDITDLDYRNSPDLTTHMTGILTPPHSNKKDNSDADPVTPGNKGDNCLVTKDKCDFDKYANTGTSTVS